MFRSCGLFAGESCPLVHRGPCERPHCFYRHDAAPSEKFGASFKSAVNLEGFRRGPLHGPCGVPVNVKIKDKGVHELEQLNKEIESVRHQVEQEKRRLSTYQMALPNTRNPTNTSKCPTEGKPADRGSSGQTNRTNWTKTQTARKYVVDNSKPRTDLEYDPLSNFSSDLLCCNSSSKEPKVKNQLDLTQTASKKGSLIRETLHNDSQNPQDDDDCVLIIDVPLTPHKVRDGTKTCDRDKSSGVAAGDIKEDKLALPPHKALRKSQAFTDASSSALYDNDCDIKNSRYSSTSDDITKCDNATGDGNVIDLTGYLEVLQSECKKLSFLQSTGSVKEKLLETAKLSPQSYQRDHNLSNSQCDWPRGTGKKSPRVQTLKNSLFLETPAASSWRQEKPCEGRTHSQSSPQHSVQSHLPGSRKMSGKVLGPTQRNASFTQTSSATVQQPASASSSQPRRSPPTSASTLSPDGGESSSEFSVEREVILISSEDEDEGLNYSDMELSDSDPMEECYRIFMEANNEEKANETHPDVSMGAVAEVKPAVPLQAKAGKNRVAHEAALAEQPVLKCRPQPKVLVPAAPEFGSQAILNSKIQLAQRRSSMLTAAAVKSGQSFVSSINKKKPENLSAAPSSIPTLHTPPAQNASPNCSPVGGTVFSKGNNLHLIVPVGAPFSSSLVTSVLTPISQPPTSTATVSQACHPPAGTAVQRNRSTAPVLISPLPRRPLTSGTSALPVLPTPAPSTSLQAKPVPVKRKLKQQQQHEAVKVPYDVRQRYINTFSEEFLKTTPNVEEAFVKALAEEKIVYSRSMNQVKYQSVAVNVLKKLRNQTATASQNIKQVDSQRRRGNIPLNPTQGKGDAALYECLRGHLLTDEGLSENNYPIQHPEKPGCAVLLTSNKKVNTDPLMRICCRCGATYSVNRAGKHIRKEECTYHYGRGVTKRVPGGVETRYSCCEGVMGAPGCQVFQLHVHDFLSLDGFVATPPRCSSDSIRPGVFSLNCEMCYAVSGLELSRVTVVNSDLQVIYDTFVKPNSEAIDYNTRFSGISEEDVKGNHTTIKAVQETLLSFISADTILIGHSLETALCLLKLIHRMVVDTSVVFPHRLGPPYKMTLKKLTAEHLRRIIQESVCGHDTAEDAAACMELMLWKVKEDGKLKK